MIQHESQGWQPIHEVPACKQALLICAPHLLLSDFSSIIQHYDSFMLLELFLAV